MTESATVARLAAVSTTNTLGEAVAHALAAVPAAVFRRVAAWAEARRTARALERLSPALLDDVGLTEADVLRYQRAARLF